MKGGGGIQDTGLVTVNNLFKNPARYIYTYIYMYIYICVCVCVCVCVNVCVYVCVCMYMYYIILCIIYFFRHLFFVCIYGFSTRCILTICNLIPNFLFVKLHSKWPPV